MPIPAPVKTLFPTAFLSLAILSAHSHGAATYEPFEYVVGGHLEGNPGWISVNSGTAPSVSAGNLAVSGLPAPRGAMVSFPGGNFQEAQGAIDTFSSGRVFFSLAFELTSLPSGAATYSFGLASSGSSYGATVFLRADGSDGFNIGLANRPTATVTFGPVKFALNTTQFIVGSYEFVAGSGNDVSSLWINPPVPAFSEAAAPQPSLTATGGSDLVNINQFLLRGAVGSPGGFMDELRAGSTWASVTPLAVPEASALPCLLGAAAMLLAGRRRR